MLLLCLCFCTTGTYAQEKTKDSIVVKHRHLKTAVGITGINVLLNRVNFHFLEAGSSWADVSWSSMKKNLATAPNWDWDLFTTNWFAHPYQGSMYYMTARNLGANEWESIAYCGFGTFMWEYLGENHPPSRNDLFTNVLGGMYLGEVIHSISENLRFKRLNKKQKIGEAALSFVINPIWTYDRLLFGKSVNRVKGNNYHYVPLKTRLMAGNIFQLHSSFNDETLVSPYLGVDLEYGQIDSNTLSYKYFDYFELNAFLRFDNTNENIVQNKYAPPYWNFRSFVVLYGKQNFKTDQAYHYFMLFQNYDYIKAKNHELGSLGFTMGGIYVQENKNNRLSLNYKLGFMALGAADSKTIHWETPTDFPLAGRDYVMGSGIIANFDLRYQHDVWGSLGFEFNLWELFVLSGPEGRESLQLFNFEYEHALSNKIDFGFVASHYFRKGNYPLPTYNFKEEERLIELRAILYYHL